MRGRPFAQWLPYAAALVGVVGFGTLYRGVVEGRLATALLGLALLLLGLDRAGRALAASMRMHAASREQAARDAPPGPADR